MAEVSVRPAVAADAAAMAEVQLETWRECYGRILPPGALAALTATAAEAHWRDSLANPPTPRHRAFVALRDGVLVGLAAYQPADDPDLDRQATAELTALLVEPGAHRQGHGSRLMAAVTDTMPEVGFAAAVTWLFDTDVATEAFFEATGWALDGAGRDLDMGQLVHQVRLHTDLRP